MAADLLLTAVYEPVENGWVQARLKEMPAVITAAPTLEEAKELLVDALREYLLSLAQEQEALVEATGCTPVRTVHEPLHIVIEAVTAA